MTPCPSHSGRDEPCHLPNHELPNGQTCAGGSAGRTARDQGEGDAGSAGAKHDWKTPTQLYLSLISFWSCLCRSHFGSKWQTDTQTLRLPHWRTHTTFWIVIWYYEIITGHGTAQISTPFWQFQIAAMLTLLQAATERLKEHEAIQLFPGLRFPVSKTKDDWSIIDQWKTKCLARPDVGKTLTVIARCMWPFDRQPLNTLGTEYNTIYYMIWTYLCERVHLLANASVSEPFCQIPEWGYRCARYFSGDVCLFQGQCHTVGEAKWGVELLDVDGHWWAVLGCTWVSSQQERSCSCADLIRPLIFW